MRGSKIAGYSMICRCCAHEWTLEKGKYHPSMACPKCGAIYETVIMETLDERDFNTCQMIDLGFAKKIEWWF